MFVENFKVQSPNVRYADDAIYARFDYDNTRLEPADDQSWTVIPTKETFEFRTQNAVPKLG